MNSLADGGGSSPAHFTPWLPFWPAGLSALFLAMGMGSNPNWPMAIPKEYRMFWPED